MQWCYGFGAGKPRAFPVNILAPSALDSLTLGAETQGPYLLLDFRDELGDPRHAEWLRAQPRPTLALAPPDLSGMPNSLIEACDIVVSSVEALVTTISNIEQSPLAASVLVETLRVTERMPVLDALVVESLAYAALQTGPEFARWKAERKEHLRPAPANEPAVLVIRDGDRLSLTLNRPNNRNAVSIDMRDALFEAFSLAAFDPSVATIEVRGNGACFSVGGDLAEFGHAPSPPEAHLIRMQKLPARALLPVAERAIFYLHGACIGAGVELPAFGGRVVARPNTFFQLPEIRFGLIPGAGGCVSIPRRVGRQRAAYLALSGRRISAQTALEWGLVDEIVA
jgi:hypothetical protein